MKKMKLLPLIGIAMIIGYVLLYRTTVEDVQITVTDKERITTNEESMYLVFTEDEVFKNTDALIFFKFNSSNIYGQLRKDSCYTVQVAGFRIPILSAYRNIIKIKK